VLPAKLAVRLLLALHGEQDQMGLESEQGSPKGLPPTRREGGRLRHWRDTVFHI
jgi:hypothetical protein